MNKYNFINIGEKIVNPQYILYIEECIGLGEYKNKFGIKIHLTNGVIYEWFDSINERHNAMYNLLSLLNQ